MEAFRVSDGYLCLQGQSLGGEKDINVHLSTPATEGERYLIRAEYEGKVVNALATVKGDTVVRIDLDRATFDAASLLAERFGPDPAKAKAAAKLLESVPFTPENAAAAWRAYLDAPDPALRADFDANVVKTADRTSPYQNEWNDLMSAIANDKPYNEVARSVQTSLVTSMGRAAAHIGKTITYDEMLNSQHVFAPNVDKMTNDGPDGSIALPSFGIYEDELVRIDGAWLFKRRKIYNEFLPGRESGPVNPVLAMDAAGID